MNDKKLNTGTADDLAGLLADEAPEPSAQADAIAATLEQARSPAEQGGPATPVQGTPSPGKSETRGRHKKDCGCATCSAKRIGQKSSASTTSAVDPVVPPAVMLVGTLTGMAQMMIDAVEWKPEKAETDNMVRAWRDLFQRYNVTDVPAGLAVLIAMGGYVLPRLSRPQTATRLQRVIAWIKGTKPTKHETNKTP